jgi:F-type H+-transporting ATPase subunit b
VSRVRVRARTRMIQPVSSAALLRAILLVGLLCGWPALVAATPQRAGEPAAAAHAAPATSALAGRARAGEGGQEHARPAAGGEHGEEHQESIWPTIARLVNFAILAGALVYFARSPFVRYLVRRAEEIRRDLEKAARSREVALAQMADIERRLTALPDELAALRKRGAEEVVAEGARIRQAAEAERVRLLEHARREIDLHLRVAERDLVRHAADLAVSVAGQRIKRIIDSQDQARLVEQYLQQLAQGQG